MFECWNYFILVLGVGAMVQKLCWNSRCWCGKWSEMSATHIKHACHKKSGTTNKSYIIKSWSTTLRQTPWTDNDSSLFFAAEPLILTTPTRSDGSAVRRRTDRPRDGCYQVQYLPASRRCAVNNYTVDCGITCMTCCTSSACSRHPIDYNRICMRYMLIHLRWHIDFNPKNQSIW